MAALDRLPLIWAAYRHRAPIQTDKVSAFARSEAETQICFWPSQSRVTILGARCVKAVLIGTVPPITVKPETNSGGTPLKTFARLRKSVVGKTYVQGPQKYHAKSLQVLREVQGGVRRFGPQRHSWVVRAAAYHFSLGGGAIRRLFVEPVKASTCLRRVLI
jgi:hypothetical protein